MRVVCPCDADDEGGLYKREMKGVYSGFQNGTRMSVGD